MNQSIIEHLLGRPAETMNCPAYPVSRLSSQYETSRIYSTSAAKLTTSLNTQVSSWPVSAWHDRLCNFFHIPGPRPF